jgi:hypothetical protein
MTLTVLVIIARILERYRDPGTVDQGVELHAREPKIGMPTNE